MTLNKIDNIILTCDNLSEMEIYCYLSDLDIFDKIVIDFYMYDKYNIDNGILLRADLHKLFDNKQLIINPTTLKISIDPTLEFNNKIINIDNNSIKYLKEYYLF
jgi:hypothetical protein